MGRVIPVIVLVALTLYCTIEVAQAKTWEVRRMPKWLWAVAVIGVPGFGPLAWLFFGRRRPDHKPPPSRAAMAGPPIWPSASSS